MMGGVRGVMGCGGVLKILKKEVRKSSPREGWLAGEGVGWGGVAYSGL